MQPKKKIASVSDTFSTAKYAKKPFSGVGKPPFKNPDGKAPASKPAKSLKEK